MPFAYRPDLQAYIIFFRCLWRFHISMIMEKSGTSIRGPESTLDLEYLGSKKKCAWTAKLGQKNP